MDQESLKMVLEAIQKLGADAQTSFCWYLAAWVAMTCIVPMLHWTGALILCGLLLRFFRWMVNQCGAADRMHVAFGCGTTMWTDDQLRLAEVVLSEYVRAKRVSGSKMKPAGA